MGTKMIIFKNDEGVSQPYYSVPKAVTTIRKGLREMKLHQNFDGDSWAVHSTVQIIQVM